MFNVYADISRVLSVVFLIVQAFLLVDLAFELNAAWERKARASHDNGSKCNFWYVSPARPTFLCLRECSVCTVYVGWWLRVFTSSPPPSLSFALGPFLSFSS